MKAEELKTCALCGRGMMHAGVPLFYQVTVQTMGVDAGAVQQQHGLETFFGARSGNGAAAVAIARVFSPDPEIAKPIGEPVKKLVCQQCSTEPNHLMRLACDE